MTYGVAYGGLGSGFTIVGPFEDAQAAITWAAGNLDDAAGGWEAVELLEPWDAEEDDPP